jgi:hypothetical protein
VTDAKTWRALCGQAVALCGGQPQFRTEARILARLVAKFGAAEVEHMIAGAKLLHWNSLKGLASADGLGRRWSLATYWQHHNQAKGAGKQLESVASLLKARGF